MPFDDRHCWHVDAEAHVLQLEEASHETHVSEAPSVPTTLKTPSVSHLTQVPNDT
jgi:hypothetical protein